MRRPLTTSRSADEPGEVRDRLRAPSDPDVRVRPVSRDASGTIVPRNDGGSRIAARRDDALVQHGAELRARERPLVDGVFGRASTCLLLGVG